MDYTNNPSAYGQSSSITSSNFDPQLYGVLLIIFAVVAIASYIINSIFLGKLFKKAGIESWKAWVPIYNQWIFLELGGQKGWISLLYLGGIIPFVGIIPSIVAAVYSSIAAYRIGINFGKEGVFVLLYVFLSLIWIIWLAVDKTAVWRPVTNEVNTGNPTPPSQPAAM